MGLNPTSSHIKPITFGKELRTYDMIPYTSVVSQSKFSSTFLET